MEQLRERIMRHEGFCEFPKPDAKGMWVVGYGHDLTASNAQDYVHGIKSDEAEDFLTADIKRAQEGLAKALPWTVELPQICQDVLVEMVFQIGVSGLMGFKNLLFNARSGNLDGVAESMLNSKWHSQTPARCEELAGLYLNGEKANA